MASNENIVVAEPGPVIAGPRLDLRDADFDTQRVYFWTIISNIKWKNVGLMQGRNPPVKHIKDFLNTIDIDVFRHVYNRLMIDATKKWPQLTPDVLSHYIALGSDFFSEIIDGSDWAIILSDAGECVIGANSFDAIVCGRM